MNRVQDEPAFVLHRRPYRETSALVDIFSLNHGRLTLVARGLGRPASARKATLQPFQALLLGWQGRSDLKTLTEVEPRPSPRPPTSQRRLLCGFYLNELLERLLPAFDPHPELFASYAQVLADLFEGEDETLPLRRFELQLASALGYGFSWREAQEPAGPLQADTAYDFDPERGFVSAPSPDALLRDLPGAALLAVAEERWDAAGARSVCKRVMRVLIDHLLQGRALHSRRLFVQMRPGRKRESQ